MKETNNTLSQHFTYMKLLKFIFPSVLMMLVTSIYTIVDGYFVSNYVGKNPFAALNLIFPVIGALGAFGFMIGAGGSALISMTLGQKDEKRANEYFSMLLKVLIIFGIITSIIAYIFMEPIAYMLGATEVLIRDCVTYGRILALANVFFMLQNCYQSFLIVADRPSMGLWISIAAGVGNMIFDYLFIVVFNWGIAGAALATSGSQFVGAIIPTIYFMLPNKTVFRLQNVRIKLSVIYKACLNGISSLLSNLSGSLVGVLYNFQLLHYASENGIAAYGVLMYVCFVFMAFFFGYSVGCNPIVGYNYGAQNDNELKNVYKKSLIIVSVVGVLMCISSIVLAKPIAQVFVGYDLELMDMSINAMKIYAYSFLIVGYNIFASSFFTGLNDGKMAAIIQVSRTLVFQILAIMILPIFLGVNGIWGAVILAEGMTFIISIVLLIINRSKYRYY